MGFLSDVVGAVVGGTIGFFASGGNPVGAFKGAVVGYSIGSSMTGTELDDVEGPRLDDLDKQDADYNIDIQRNYGDNRLSGNVIWLKDDKIKETFHTTKTKTGGFLGFGGDSSTTRSFTYSATFAVAICEGPIAGIKKIFADGVLIVDYTSSPSSFDVVVISNPNEILDKITFHSAGSNNTVDPLILAAETTAPAFRGVSYVVFEDLPLGEYQNRIPHLSFEVADVESGSSTTAGELREVSANTLPAGIISAPIGAGIETMPWFSVFGILFGLKIDINASGSVDYENASTTGVTTYTNVHKMVIHRMSSVEVGTLLGEEEIELPASALFGGVFGSDYDNVRVYTIPGSPGLLLISWRNVAGDYRTGIGVVTGGVISVFKAGDLFATTKFFTSVVSATFTWGNIYISTEGASASGSQFEGVNGIVKLAFVGTPPILPPVNSSADAIEYEKNILESSINSDNVLRGIGADILTGTIYGIDNSTGNSLLEFNSDLVLLNTYTLNTTGANGDLFVSGNFVSYMASGGGTIVTVKADGGVLTAVNSVSSTVGGDLLVVWYATVAFFARSKSTPWARDASPEGAYYLTSDFFTDDTNTTVEEVIQREMSFNPFLNFGDVDTSNLASEAITGFAVSSRSSLAATLKPLMIAHQFDIYEADYQIKFRSRVNGALTATITSDDLQAHELGSDVPDQAVIDIKSDQVVPSVINVSYRDADREYEVGSQQAERLNSISNSSHDVDLPITSTATKAAKIADILLQNAWLESQGMVQVRTSFKYSFIERADLISVVTDNATLSLRVIDIEKGKPGIVVITGVLDNVNNYTSSAVGETGRSITAALTPIAPTGLVIVDTVALRNNDLDYGFYFGVYPLGTTRWGGATIASSADYSNWITMSTMLNALTVGTATDKLDATQLLGVFDTSDTLNIEMSSGTFSTATETAVRGGVNTLAYGRDRAWEIIKFQTATLEGDGTYTISNLLRGYYGTEMHMGTHRIGDKVVLMSDDTLINRLALRNSEMYNTTQYYNATSLNTVFSLDLTTTRSIKSEGEVHRAPQHIKATRASDAINITWFRSKRAGREWIEGDWTTSDTFTFEVDILNGAGGAVLRTITETGSSLFNVDYSSALQTTDFGSPQTAIYVNIYQTDTVTGRGHVGQGLAI